MFLDYGNVEEVEPTELQSLDDKFLAYPFRVSDGGCHGDFGGILTSL